MYTHSKGETINNIKIKVQKEKIHIVTSKHERKMRELKVELFISEKKYINQMSFTFQFLF